MNEFTVSIKSPAVVDGNFEEIKEGLKNMMHAYEGLEVTEETIPERKKDVAALRKIAEAIEKKRKGIKKDYEAPLKEFEGKCKELTGIINEQVERLDGGLKEFEEKRKKEKRARIAELYKENIGEYAEYLPLRKIESPAWLNKTTTEKAIIADIQEARLKVEQEISMINTVYSEFAEECLKAYKESGNNLQAAVKRNNDLEYARRKAEEAAAEKERQKEMDARVDARLQNLYDFTSNIKQASQEAAQNIYSYLSPLVGTAADVAESYTFTVYREEDAEMIRAYMESFDIEYTEGGN